MLAKAPGMADDCHEFIEAPNISHESGERDRVRDRHYRYALKGRRGPVSWPGEEIYKSTSATYTEGI